MNVYMNLIYIFYLCITTYLGAQAHTHIQEFYQIIKWLFNIMKRVYQLSFLQQIKNCSLNMKYKTGNEQSKEVS